MRVFDTISEWLGRKSSVQMVADDPQMASEILLLIRTMFADGEMLPEELATFKILCFNVFEIPDDDIPEVVRFLKQTSYETTFEQAAVLLSELPEKRKNQLMSHLMMMAMADSKLHEKEKEILSRVAGVLGFEPERIKSLI